MSKFNTSAARAAGRSPVRTQRCASGRTGQGGPGYAREDVRSELYLLAVTHIPREDTFYEPAQRRHDRLVELVREAAIHDFDWLTGLARWLRTGETHAA